MFDQTIRELCFLDGRVLGNKGTHVEDALLLRERVG